MPIPEDKKVDHLILLVGGNPLPNYVAARLLGRDPANIHLVHTSQTDDVADKLIKRLDPTGKIKKLPVTQEPFKIYAKIDELIKNLGPGSVGLHYTGGTKAMAAQAYHAARSSKGNVQLSYLDARSSCLYFEGVSPDAHAIPFSAIDDPRVALTVHEIMELHGISLQRPDGSNSFEQHVSTKRLLIAQAILNSNLDHWADWISKNLRGWNEKKKKHEFLKGGDLKAISAPVDEFPHIANAFNSLGQTSNTLQEWARLAEFPGNSDSMIDFARFLEGGWLETQVFRLLEKIKTDSGVPLFDIGMNYSSFDGGDELFEFDMAATRGYRLYAASCTTDSSQEICRSKLFEVFYRAGQMGGDESRAALVCNHKDPDMLYKKFRREFDIHENAARIFTIEDLKQALTDPVSDARKKFESWLKN